MSNNLLGGHGAVGKREQLFTELKDLRSVGYDMHDLAILASGMDGPLEDLGDGPDTEENLYVPAGYTYFGQFVDHDITFDTTSSLDPRSIDEPTNLRSPRFDLDCVYGGGPSDQPYMYDADGATLLLGGRGPQTPLDTPWDLLRSSNGRAIIGDKRNDENSIVNQIQQTFIKFHNRVTQELKVTKKLTGGDLFKAARNEVRWAYQRILVDDFLPRIISADVLGPFVAQWRQEGEDAYLWYTEDIRYNLPREFVVAAYRFGHSGVRTGYRMNGQPGKNNGFARLIFDGTDKAANSLVGFDPLPQNHVIDDWGRFFPLANPMPGCGATSNVGANVVVGKDGSGGEGRVRLQYAYKLDTKMVDPLVHLPPKIGSPDDVPAGAGVSGPPSLALLNLLRGSRYKVQSGQAFAEDLGCSLPKECLSVRIEDPAKPKTFLYKPICELADAKGHVLGHVFDEDTPLWFYILAEAQRPLVELWMARKAAGKSLTEDDLLGNPPATGGAKPGNVPNQGAGTQLGPVGGRIVAEVFYGLLDADDESFVRAAPADWSPIWGGTGPATMAKLLAYTGLPITG